MDTSEPQGFEEWRAATYRQFLEPLFHFSVDSITLFIHKLGEPGVHLAKHVKDARARAECVACLMVRLWQAPKYMKTYWESPPWVSLQLHPSAPWQASCAKSQRRGQLRCNRPRD